MNESQWHELLKKELKTDDLGRFLKRPAMEGFELDLLATRSESWRDGNFCRAALSMSLCDESLIDWKQVPAWVESGVWDFILDPFLLGWDDHRLNQEMPLIESVLKLCPARIWIAHSKIKLPQGAFRILSAREIHAQGGNAIHEMSSVLSQVIDWAQSGGEESLAIAAYMDREFFKSIAKMRALKAMTESILTLLGQRELQSRLTWMARVSWREFTAYDQASNMLRNANALAAGYLTGVAVVESLPADLLVENGLKLESSRVALTTQLILQNEAGLGEVVDAASGCYSIENLTRALGDKAWSEMQHLQSLPIESRESYLTDKAKNHWKEVQEKFRKRKIVQAGVNDFAQTEEVVELKNRWKRADHVRLGRDFEELRMQLGSSRPRVMIRLVGEYAALQARFNFAKNFFELLGLNPQERKFNDPNSALEWRDDSEIQVWVTGDDLHHQLKAVGERCYVAGKTSVPNCENIFHGIDICHALRELLLWWSKRV